MITIAELRDLLTQDTAYSKQQIAELVGKALHDEPPEAEDFLRYLEDHGYDELRKECRTYWRARFAVEKEVYSDQTEVVTHLQEHQILHGGDLIETYEVDLSDREIAEAIVERLGVEGACKRFNLYQEIKDGDLDMDPEDYEEVVEWLENHYSSINHSSEELNDLHTEIIGIDLRDLEVHSWMHVSRDLFQSLKEAGVIVAEGMGSYWWGRTSGCDIHEDPDLLKAFRPYML